MPNPNVKEFPLTFEKGLVIEVEESTLDLGQAAALRNWEPLPQGGLRARNSWSAISTLGLPTNYKVRGWGTVAIGGGGGFATPSVVQSNSTVGTLGTDETVSLTGTVAGNQLVGYLMDASDTAHTVSGWTLVRSETASTRRIAIYQKTSTGGAQSFAVTAGTSIEAVAIFELSGVVVGAATATAGQFNSADSSQISLSAASPAASGVAIGGGTYEFTGTPPTDKWWNEAGWTKIRDFVNGSVFDHCIGHKVYSATPITSNATPNSASDMGGVMAIWDAEPAAAVPADFYLLLAVATSTGYSIYRIPRSGILSGTWELVDSEACSDTSAFVSMSVGAGELVWSASTMSNPRHVVLSTLTGADTTDLASKAGRATAYHKDRMFVGGSSALPSRLYFSGIGTPHTFTTATDFLDVGGDDGEAIEDLVSVEGLLLVCKTNRLYLISGSGVESFFVNELPGGTASTGRAAVRTPYGTIVAGPTDVWVVQGGGVDPMSRPLGVGYSVAGLVSTAYAQDSVLICDSATGTIYRANLVTGAWQLEDVTEGENEPGHLFSLQGRLYYGVLDSATQAGGTRRLSSDRSYDFTGGTSYEASTGRLALLGPSVKYTPQHLFLQLRNHDTAHQNILRVIIETDQGSEAKSFTVTSDTQREWVSLGQYKGAEWIQVHFSADSSAIAGAIDVEKSVLSVIVENVR